MTEDEEINSRNKGKFNRRKKMKTSIRDTKVSSTEERKWKYQLKTQMYVELKKEGEDIISGNKDKFSWRKKMKASIRDTKIISNEQNSKTKTSIRDTKISPTEERILRHKF